MLSHFSVYVRLCSLGLSRSGVCCFSPSLCVYIFFSVFFTVWFYWLFFFFFFFSSRRRHTSCLSDWSSDVCSSDLGAWPPAPPPALPMGRSGCALWPSSTSRRRRSSAKRRASLGSSANWRSASSGSSRSEERRVGKECRARGTP